MFLLPALFVDADSSENSSVILTETVTFIYDEIGDPIVKKQLVKKEVSKNSYQIIVVNLKYSNWMRLLVRNEWTVDCYAKLIAVNFNTRGRNIAKTVSTSSYT